MFGMVKQQDIALVRQFSGLQPETLDALARQARLYTLKDRQVLYHQGDTADAFYIVLSGGARLVEHMDSGDHAGLKVYGPGEAFGLLAISGSFPHPSEVSAMGEARIAAINGADARAIMHRHPDFGVAIVDMLVAHIHHAHTRLSSMMADRADRKLARALLVYARKFGTDDDHGRTLISVPVLQADLARFVAISPETVSRLLKQFNERGLLAGRSPLCICDHDSLRSLAGEGDINLSHSA